MLFWLRVVGYLISGNVCPSVVYHAFTALEVYGWDGHSLIILGIYNLIFTAIAFFIHSAAHSQPLP